MLAPRLYDLEAELIPGGEPSSRFEDDLDAELILDGEPISHPTPHPEHTQTLSRPYPRPHPDQAQTRPRPRSDHSQTTSQTQTMPDHIQSTSQSHYGRPSTPRSSCQSQRKVAQLVMLRKQLVTLRKQLGWLQNANMNPIELARKFKCPVYELSDGASKSSSKRN